MDPADLLLVLLYAPGKSRRTGEPVEGITRLQKLIFLLLQGRGPGAAVEHAQGLGYRPYKMGPYSSELGVMLDELELAGIVHTERLRYLLPDDRDETESDPRVIESKRFSLTSDFGATVAKDVWDSLDEEFRDQLTEFKSFFNSLTLRQLLVYTYEEFPQFARESTIKTQLGLA